MGIVKFDQTFTTMISVIGSTKGEYILQPGLLEKHRQTLEWLSATLLWEKESSFLQKILDLHAGKITLPEEKQTIHHCQNLLLYYRSELIYELAKKLRDHEKRLAETLRTKDESRTEYFKEHDALMNELESFSTSFTQLKGQIFDVLEKVL